MYRDERERKNFVNYINKVSRQMKYKLKKKFINNIPANDVVVKSPVSSMNDDQWGALVKLWSSRSTRDKFGEEPTAVEHFREFHSSQKTSSVSETVQKAFDDMEESVQGEEPLSPDRAVPEVVQARTFLEVVGFQPKKKNQRFRFFPAESTDS
ncbi:hypothetical protein EJB05_00243, partial [Eragrostis curvula]